MGDAEIYLLCVIGKIRGFFGGRFGIVVIFDVASHVLQYVEVVVGLEEDVLNAPLTILHLHRPADGDALEGNGILDEEMYVGSAVGL